MYIFYDFFMSKHFALCLSTVDMINKQRQCLIQSIEVIIFGHYLFRFTCPAPSSVSFFFCSQNSISVNLVRNEKNIHE